MRDALRSLPLAGAALLALLWAGTASAEGPQLLQVTVEAPQPLRVGDHFFLIVVVEHDPGVTFMLPVAGVQVGQLDLLAVEQKTVAAASGRERTTLRLELAAFVTGGLLAGPLALPYTDPEGEGFLDVPPQRVLVSSVLPPQPRLALEGFYDVGPPLAVAGAEAWWLRPAVYGALALGAVGAVGLVLVVARRLPRRVPKPPPPLTPEELVLSELEELSRGELLSAGDAAAHYGRLGTAVRRYLSSRHRFPAMAMTTREIGAAMLARRSDRWQSRLVTGLLEECDAVSFGRYAPAPARAEHDLALAYEVVQMSTRPSEEAAAVPAPGG